MTTTTHETRRATGTERQMTTTTTAPGVPAAINLPRGVARALRLHTVTLGRTLTWPWAILALSFAVNLALYFTGANDDAKGQGTGGLASLYIVVTIAYLQAMTQLFSFALGIGVSRRSFFLGTIIFAVAESLFFGGVIYTLGVIERATDGWGVGLAFFGVPWLTHGANPLELLVTYIAPLFVLASVAMFLGILHKRWGSNGLLWTSAIGVLVLGGAAVLVNWQGGWNAIGHWFASQSALALTAGWPWLLAAAALAGTWLIMRRTTP
jgi:hypothetical protein